MLLLLFNIYKTILIAGTLLRLLSYTIRLGYCLSELFHSANELKRKSRPDKLFPFHVEHLPLPSTATLWKGILLWLKHRNTSRVWAVD